MVVKRNCVYEVHTHIDTVKCYGHKCIDIINLISKIASVLVFIEGYSLMIKCRSPRSLVLGIRNLLWFLVRSEYALSGRRKL